LGGHVENELKSDLAEPHINVRSLITAAAESESEFCLAAINRTPFAVDCGRKDFVMSIDSSLYVPLGDIDFFISNPFPDLAKLRREAPVYRDGDTNSWAITTHADVSAVAKQPEIFSSETALRPDNGGELMLQFLSGSLVLSQPPRHTMLRKIVNRAFTPRAVAELEDFTRNMTIEILDRIVLGQTHDLVHEIRELPVGVICALMGVPREEHGRIAHMMDLALSVDSTDPEPFANTEGMLAAMADGMAYLGEFVTKCRVDHVPGLITRISEAEELTEHDVLQFAFLLLMAGSETTRGLMARGTELLAAHTDQRQQLVDDLGGLPVAIEEMLRWCSVLPMAGRKVLQDTKVRDVSLKAGDQLYLYYLSANRDEEVFGDDAEDFRIDRAKNPHLAFGLGPHFCLGANLTRLEAKVFFQQLLTRKPNFELAGEPESPRTFELSRGRRYLPLMWS
jgi:cytochrome P450